MGAVSPVLDRFEKKVGDQEILQKCVVKPVIAAAELIAHFAASAPLVSHAKLVSKGFTYIKAAFGFTEVVNNSVSGYKSYRDSKEISAKVAYNFFMKGIALSVDELCELRDAFVKSALCPLTQIELRSGIWAWAEKCATILLPFIGMHFLFFSDTPDLKEFGKSFYASYWAAKDVQDVDGVQADKIVQAEWVRCKQMFFKVIVDLAYVGLGVAGCLALASGTLPFAASIVAMQPACANVALLAIAYFAGAIKTSLEIWEGDNERTKKVDEAVTRLFNEKFYGASAA